MCENLYQSSDSCEDINAAVALPIIVEGEEYSANLDDFVGQERHKHEEIYTKMHHEIDHLLESVEKETSQYIQVAKDELLLIKNNITDSIRDGVNSVEQWIAISEKTKKQEINIHNIIDELLLDLKSAEKAKSESLKNTLMKHKQEAISLRFNSIETIDRDFEELIKSTNLKTLENIYHYEDLHLQLQLEGQEITNECQQLLKKQLQPLAEQKARLLWKKIEDKQSKRLLTEAIFNMANESHSAREDFSQVAKRLVDGLSEFADGLQLPTEYDVRGDNWGSFIETLNEKLTALDALCKSVELILKSAIASLVENFENQMNVFTRTTGKKFLEGLQEDSRFSTELANFKDQQEKELQYLKSKWQKTVNVLSSKIEQSKTFVLDLTAIWTNHVARVNNLHKEVETTLESAYKASVKKYKEKDAKLKGLMKNIREAKDLTKLENLSDNLKEKFREIVVDLENSYEAQLEMMEDTKLKGVQQLIQEKQSHLRDFLNNKYRKKEWFTSLSRSGSIGSIELSEPIDVEIENQIDLCNTYVAAVENRTLGMYEMLERYAPQSESLVKEETDEWMNMFIQDVINNYDSLLNEVEEYQTKTMRELKDIRFAEIHIHSRRLLSHVSGANYEISELNKRLDEIKSHQMLSLNVFNEKALRLPTEDVNIINQAISDLEQEWNCLSETLSNKIVEGKGLCEARYAAIKEANSLFLKTAKNFKNGGNYSPEELKTLNKELNQLGKLVTNHKKTIFKKYDDLMKGISRNVFDSRIEQLNAQLKPMVLHKKIADTLSITRMRLRAEVNRMKSKCKDIKRQISQLASLNLLDKNMYNDIIALVIETQDYMIFPTGMRSLECTESGNHSLNITTTTKAPNKDSKPSAGPLFKHAGDEILHDDNKFLSRVKCLILKKYDDLLHSIREATLKPSEAVKKATPSKAKEPIETSMPDLETQQVNLVKRALRSYNCECELAWISQSQEFFDQLANLKKNFNISAKFELQHIHQNYMNSLGVVEREYLHLVNEENSKGETERTKITRSLVLPLAHPSQHRKLSGLREKATDHCQSTKKKFKKLLAQHKLELQNKHDNYVEKIKNLKENLNDLQNKLFSEELCKELLEISKGIRDVMPYEDDNAVEDSVSPECPDYPTSIWCDENDLLQGPQKSRSICLVLLSRSSKDSGHSLAEKFDDIRVIPINRAAAEQVKESALHIQKLYDQARLSEQSDEEVVDSWRRSLESNIKEARHLHSSICNG